MHTFSPHEEHNSEAHPLAQIIQRIRHWLPTQGPIKDFIHHNTLHAFQSRPFHEALRVASDLYGAHSYLDLSEYHEAFKRGQITMGSLKYILKTREGATTDPAWLLQEETARGPRYRPISRSKRGVHSLWSKKHGVELDSLVHPILFRFLGNFLDQGISIWRMPHAKLSFWKAIGQLNKESVFSIGPLKDRSIAPLFEMSPIAAIDACLKLLVGNESLYESYLLEMLLEHPGWSGMVSMVEENPGYLLDPRRITLTELVAVELILEVGSLQRALGPAFEPIGLSFEGAPAALPEKAIIAETGHGKKARLLHEAYEWTHYSSILWGIEKGALREIPDVASPSVQAFFCIDDRFSSVRRHLEEVAPTVSTWATAGFFGIDFCFQAAGTLFPTQYCPVVIKPKHLVREKSEEGSALTAKSSGLPLAPESHTLVRGWLLSQTVGLVALFRLALNVLKPGFRLLTDKNLSQVHAPTSLQLLREGDTKTEEGYWLGYSVEEMADRVAGVFRSTGLKKDFAPLVIIFGHGSSSANNPHFAAYDCGACSGRAGAPNARSFAWMANHPPVRLALKSRGIDLTADTHVLGALYDTARDEATFFDTAALSPRHQMRFHEFRRQLTEATKRNAWERTRRFELAPREMRPDEAHAHVEARAQSIFEPRPELNHATNSLCIVGRRSLTKGIFLDRRAFLNSYDPTTDPDGTILSGILGAVIPVCGGINLEYYFSRIDTRVYGAGTKLPHNVVALVGVANGVEGDLQTGLPSQMTEVHDPVRLMTLVEQEPEVALAAIKKNPAIFEWVKNEWVFYACFSPTLKKSFFFSKDGFVPMETAPAEHRVLTMGSSMDVVARHASNIGVHFIGDRK